jgi:hypothetical protein
MSNSSISRRNLLGAGPLVVSGAPRLMAATERVERWGLFETILSGPHGGRPFVDVQLSADFRHQNRSLTANGFYDGAGTYRIRFMPDLQGEWSFTTRSNVPELDGKTGHFSCIDPSAANHGPVIVQDSRHLAYADGWPHNSFGTTCYAWAHQSDELETRTVKSLKGSPFNKVRMCVLPSEQTTVRIPFDSGMDGKPDFSRFNVDFFRNLDKQIADLRDLGIEADLILFHPYDHLGYQRMSMEDSHRYLRYVVARFSAYRNVWWSISNEFDLVKTKSMSDWDEYFRVVQSADPYNHLRSIHYSRYFYDYSKSWVTHLSLQSDDFTRTAEWLAQYQKPIIFDECKYEGNIARRWGNLTGHEMMRRFWLGVTSGAYVGHSETYSDDNGVAWTSKGGALLGESPKRIAFLSRIIQDGPAGLITVPEPYYLYTFKPKEYYLYYFDLHQLAEYEINLPQPESYVAELIDPWEMTITPVSGAYNGKFKLKLPGKAFQALRLTRIGNASAPP